jgi:hypothetical protein
LREQGSGKKVVMAQPHKVGMYLLHGGTPRDRQAWDELRAALPDGDFSEADELGVFEITIDAEDQEPALLKVWNAVARSGTDDHVLFLEHPSLPGHWRERSAAPG